MRQYWVYYRGTGYGVYIAAKGPKDAMRRFAKMEGVTMSSYIAWRSIS